MFRTLASLCLGIWIVVGHASEQVIKVGELKISGVFSSEMPASTHSAAAYLTIENTGNSADRLMSLDTPIGEKIMLHETSQHDHGVEMQKKESLVIMPESIVTFAPGHSHIMITEVKKKMAVGTSFPITLHFERAGSVEVLVPVKALAEQ